MQKSHFTYLVFLEKILKYAALPLFIFSDLVTWTRMIKSPSLRTISNLNHCQILTMNLENEK